jgi:hypothetical protein
MLNIAVFLDSCTYYLTHKENLTHLCVEEIYVTAKEVSVLNVIDGRNMVEESM